MATYEKPTNETLELWHKNPKNWKWGCIYYNIEDKRIFPPKKNKYLGWTVNFANPLSILVLIIITISVILISSYFKKL